MDVLIFLKKNKGKFYTPFDISQALEINIQSARRTLNNLRETNLVEYKEETTIGKTGIPNKGYYYSYKNLDEDAAKISKELNEFLKQDAIKGNNRDQAIALLIYKNQMEQLKNIQRLVQLIEEIKGDKNGNKPEV